MSLVWEPDPNRKRDRGRVLPFVFQVRSEAISANGSSHESESAAASKKTADAASTDKLAKILRMRY
jgi:hypothetical protein